MCQPGARAVLRRQAGGWNWAEGGWDGGVEAVGSVQGSILGPYSVHTAGADQRSPQGRLTFTGDKGTNVPCLGEALVAS